MSSCLVPEDEAEGRDLRKGPWIWEEVLFVTFSGSECYSVINACLYSSHLNFTSLRGAIVVTVLSTQMSTMP